MAVTDPFICHMVVLLATLNGLNSQVAQTRDYQVTEHSAEDSAGGYYGGMPASTAPDVGFPVGFGDFSGFFDKSDDDGTGFPYVGFFPFEIQSRESNAGLKPVLPSSTFWMGPPVSLTSSRGVGASSVNRAPANSGEEHSSEDSSQVPPPPPSRDESYEEEEGSAEKSSSQWSSDEESEGSPPDDEYSDSPSPRAPPRYSPRLYKTNQLPYNPLRSYYKTVGTTKSPQINKSYLKTLNRRPNENKKLQVHQHSFGIRHDPAPRKNSGKYYSQRRASDRSSPKKFDYPSAEWEFRPSPPDHYRDDLDRISDFSDFTPEHSHVNAKKVKSDSFISPNARAFSCERTNKTVAVKSQVKLECFICSDGKTGRIFEECREENPKNKTLSRRKREANETDALMRGKRQYDYGSDEDLRREYRYEPERFSGEDLSLSYEEDGSFERDRDRDRDSEKCREKKKGEMICVTCENTKTGGTYEQCSYGSDPKKNKYEKSYSKSYGSRNRGEKGFGPSKRRPLASSEDSPDDHDESPLRAPPKRRHFSNKSIPSSLEDDSERIPPRPSRRPASRKLYSSSTKGPVRDNYKWIESRRRGPMMDPIHIPPPSSRAYSTPPPIGPDPFSIKIPDPYNPPDIVSVDVGYDDDDVASPSSRENYRGKIRKYDDFDADYDTPFSFYPRVSSSDSDPISVPPVDYETDEADDYTIAPSRRIGEGGYPMKMSQMSTPKEGVSETVKSYDVKKNNVSFNQRHNNVTCKHVKKDQMTCLQCTGLHGTRSEECMYVAESEPKSKKLTFAEPIDSYEAKRNASNLKGSQNEPRGFQQSTPRGAGSHNSRDFQRIGHFQTNVGPPGERRDSRAQNYPQTANQYGHYQHAQASEINISERGKRKFKKYASDDKKSFGDKDPSSIGDTDKISSRYRAHPTYSQHNNSRVDYQDRASRGGKDKVSADTPALKQMSDAGIYNTDHAFNPILRMSLPKYTTTKSEHETVFDEVANSG